MTLVTIYPVIAFLLVYRVQRQTSIRSRDMKESNIVALKNQLKNIDWELLLSDDDVNVNMNSLHNILQEQIEQFVPYREYTVNPKRL